jgi:hypothetical protein
MVWRLIKRQEAKKPRKAPRILRPPLAAQKAAKPPWLLGFLAVKQSLATSMAFEPRP